MTVDQILIVAFGFPTIGLLTGIFYRMGKIEGAYDALKSEVERVWSEIKIIKEAIS